MTRFEARPSSAGLGVGIVTADRPETLSCCLASLVHPWVQRIHILDVGQRESSLPAPLLRALVKAGISYQVERSPFEPSLPASRALLEQQLVTCGCRRLLLADDDLIFVSGYLDWARANTCSGMRMADSMVVGGRRINGWDEGDVLSAEAYRRWFASPEVTPLGHVVACTAVYPIKFVGLWEKVAKHLTFAGEDQAWLWAVYKNDGHFLNRESPAALHVPPTPPRRYTEEDLAPLRRFREVYRP